MDTIRTTLKGIVIQLVDPSQLVCMEFSMYKTHLAVVKIQFQWVRDSLAFSCPSLNRKCGPKFFAQQNSMPVCKGTSCVFKVPSGCVQSIPDTCEMVRFKFQFLGCSRDATHVWLSAGVNGTQPRARKQGIRTCFKFYLDRHEIASLILHSAH